MAPSLRELLASTPLSGGNAPYVEALYEEFLSDPLGPPLVPNWVRVWAGVPDAGARLLAAVAKADASVRRSWR